METRAFDIVVIGAGMAGATAAAHLSADRRVALVETEAAAGYHTTGRSAAMWILNYGPADVRTMTGLSRSFLEAPPAGFTESPLVSRRAVLTVASAGHEGEIAEALAQGKDIVEIAPAAARALVPALREGYVAAAALEAECFDLDVAALLGGFLRRHRGAGGELALRSRAGRIERSAGLWHVETAGGVVFTAPVVVNAAGSWGDEVAVLAGVRPLGLVAKRRTAVILDPAPWAVADWPMTMDAGNPWYARAEARTKLLLSPVDETPTTPQDARPDELDIAIAIDRMQAALDIAVRRVEHSWAGLRTFTPDGSLAIGWDGAAEGFFWSVGQGGYGIQTSPAQGQLVADLVLGRDLGSRGGLARQVDPRRFAAAHAA